MSLTLINLAAMVKGASDRTRDYFMQDPVWSYSRRCPALARLLGGGIPGAKSALEGAGKEILRARALHAPRFHPASLEPSQAARYDFSSVIRSISSQREGIQKALDNEGVKRIVVNRVMDSLAHFEKTVRIVNALSEHKNAYTVQALVDTIGPAAVISNKTLGTMERILMNPDILKPGAYVHVTKGGELKYYEEADDFPLRFAAMRVSKGARALAEVRKDGLLDWHVKPKMADQMVDMMQRVRRAERLLEAQDKRESVAKGSPDAS